MGTDTNDDLALRTLLESEEPKITPAQPRTLLPSRLASVVSLVTATSSFSLRLGGFIGGAAINAARAGTLTSLEISRVIFEGILTRAGQDVAASTMDNSGKISAEGILMSSLSVLHRSITQTAFLISAGFQIGSTGLSSGIAGAQILLSALDAICGDTQTSRAVATIVVLAQREFKNPQTGLNSQRVGLSDVLVGTTAFAILQRWGEKQTEQEMEEAGVRETVWDMVVVAETEEDIDNTLAKVEKTKQLEEIESSRPGLRTRSVSFVSAHGTGEAFDAVGDGKSFISVNTGTTSASHLQRGYAGEEAFRQAIINQLMPGTNVSLIAESLIQDTVTVDVDGDGEFLYLKPPLGFVLVAKETQARMDGSTRLTFQRKRKRRRKASFEVEKPLPGHSFSVTPHDTDQPQILPSEPESPESHEGNGNELMELSYPNMPIVRSTSPGGGDNDAFSMDRTRSTERMLANQARIRSPPISQPNGATFACGLEPDMLYNAGDAADVGHSPVRKSMKKGKSVRKLVDFWSRDRPKRKGQNDNGPQFFQAGVAGLNTRTYNQRDQFLQQHHSLQALTQIPPQPSAEESDLRRSIDSRHSKNQSSMYSITSNNSETSLVPYSQYGGEIEQSVSAQLYREGYLPGRFPSGSLVSNMARFAKFAIASYGSTFLRLINSWQNDAAVPMSTEDLPEHHTFSSYIRLPPSSVLLSSYTDPEGGRTAAGPLESGLPLVHYISIDHESKAVVLTCRGTLGFEDVLTDMTGDYDDIEWLGEAHKVHKGILASARRLLTLHNGRVLATLQAALQEFEDYGMILCGHSLGGSVAAVLAVLLSQRSTSSAGGPFQYVTFTPHATDPWLTLPPNRPIHCFAYGPAASFSPSLQQATTGLITTVIHGRDAIPYLSLGTLIDFQAMALAFATDSHNAKTEVLRRIKDGLYAAFRDRTGLGTLSQMFATEEGTVNDEEDYWPWIALKSLRASMLAEKVGPPGEVFTIESQPVLQRHAFVAASSREQGSRVETRSFRPATHVKLRHVVDVERHFGEIKFGASMFNDHFPSRYESVLATLNRGLGN